MINKVYCMDNMEFMANQKDCIMVDGKQFCFRDVLAIPDPPYGNGEEISKNDTRGKAAYSKKYKKYESKRPDSLYFKELFRISNNQIIWGGNYFVNDLYDSSAWIVWDKLNEATDFADCELAWTSFFCATRKFSFRWNGMLQGNMKSKEVRIHRHQKPIALYKWLLKNYAQPGQFILDTHVGSGSSRIACYDMGFDFVGCELDPDFWQAQEKRFQDHIASQELFRTEEIQNLIYSEGLL